MYISCYVWFEVYDRTFAGKMEDYLESMHKINWEVFAGIDLFLRRYCLVSIEIGFWFERKPINENDNPS